MAIDLKRILLRPGGRLDRTGFAVGSLALIVIVFAGALIIRALGPGTTAGFFFGLVFYPILLPFFLYSVFGQRLHDMGRSVWPLTGLLFLLFLILLGVAMAYGGTEYFEAYSKFDRKDVIDEGVKADLDTTYESQLANGGANLTKVLMSLALGAFTLWCAIAPGQRVENRYGPVVGNQGRGGDKAGESA